MDIRPQQRKGGKKQSKTRFFWLGSYIIVAAICLILYCASRFELLIIPAKYRNFFERATFGGFLTILILSISKSLEIIIAKRARSKYKRYNLIRLTHLMSIFSVGFIIISFLFANWYAAAVSLGLFSLILGFALQTPISSFIAWIYIIIRNPYRIGDRIQIDTFKGDVLEIGYLDTTLWEFAGDYLTNDLPSGRLIRFPNSLVLQSSVFNYSWRNFMYIWNEIPFHVAYESDLDFVMATVKDAVKKELGPQMQQRIEELKELVKESPIEDMHIKEYPFVCLRISSNTWVEVSVTYLVPPKEAASIRTRIITAVIDVLQKHPDKTLFPKSNAR